MLTIEYLQIKVICDKIYRTLGTTPKVDVVKLVSAGEDEVLKVDPDSGRVFFKHFSPHSQELDG